MYTKKFPFYQMIVFQMTSISARLLKNNKGFQSTDRYFFFSIFCFYINLVFLSPVFLLFFHDNVI